jgi:hypothetical protein
MLRLCLLVAAVAAVASAQLMGGARPLTSDELASETVGAVARAALKYRNTGLASGQGPWLLLSILSGTVQTVSGLKYRVDVRIGQALECEIDLASDMDMTLLVERCEVAASSVTTLHTEVVVRPWDSQNPMTVLSAVADSDPEPESDEATPPTPVDDESLPADVNVPDEHNGQSEDDANGADSQTPYRKMCQWFRGVPRIALIVTGALTAAALLGTLVALLAVRRRRCRQMRCGGAPHVPCKTVTVLSMHRPRPFAAACDGGKGKFQRMQETDGDDVSMVSV